MLALLAACTRPPASTIESEAETTTPVVLPSPAPVAVETAAGNPDPSDELFSVDRLHALDIGLGDSEIASLQADPYAWVHATVTADGAVLADVGARLKGHIGSFRTLDEKAAFKLDFDMFVPGRRWLGEERINVNNAINDATMVHDRAAWDVYSRGGVPAPRVGYAWVTVNGEDYGVYPLIEEYDLRFLERNFADPAGNLYDGDYAVPPDGSYPHCDFTADEIGWFTLDEGVDVQRADLAAVAAASAAAPADGWDEALADAVSLDDLAAFYAGESFVGQDDGYCFNSNNYRAYFDPALDGAVRLLPWDHEAAFNAGTLVGAPAGELAGGCHDDPSCRDRLVAAVADLCAALDLDAVQADLDAAANLIDPWVQFDPRMEIDRDLVPSAQRDLRAWLASRCDGLADQVAG